MKNFVDYTGKFSGEIEFLRKVGKKGNYQCYECLCHKCGKKFEETSNKILFFFSKLPRGSDKSLKHCRECQSKLVIENRKKRKIFGSVPIDKSIKDPYLLNNDVVCAGCHKVFDVSGFCMVDYAYRYKEKIFCCYSCYRKYMNSIEHRLILK